ncbi:hypothetical protein SESBI_17817 [Sesbania bispinosa]|nr:hypothetical protein SESBI_17817 [Sesbania bispinosa]
MGKQFSGYQKQSQILLFNGNNVCLWLVDHNGEALRHHEDPKQREAGNCCKGSERLSSHLVHRMGVVGLSRKWSNNSVEYDLNCPVWVWDKELETELEPYRDKSKEGPSGGE